MKKTFPTIEIICPWCGKSKIIVQASGPGTLSNCCPKCGRYYIANFITKTATRSKAFSAKG